MKAQAWILSITDTLLVAVGEFELVHILPDSVELHRVPKAPFYCQQVFVWQNKVIPVMDLAAGFGFQQKSTASEHSFISIFAYRAEKTGLIEFGALLLTDTPRRKEVSDEQACALTTDLYAWRQYFKSCFKDSDTQKEIPILKLERLFAHQY